LNRERLGALGDVRRRERTNACTFAMRDALSVEKRCGHGGLYGEIYILWNVAGGRSNLQRVDLRNDDADYSAVPVEKRATAVPRLNGCGDLQKPAAFQLSVALRAREASLRRRPRLSAGRRAKRPGKPPTRLRLPALPHATALNDRGVRTARGGAWHDSVRNILARAG
jgi:hypothetical protein